MAFLRLPNRTAQAGVYKTGTPNYVDVDEGFAAIAGMVTFDAKATDDGWLALDLVSVLIKKDNSNYKVWIATWDATNKYLKLDTEEETVGTISDADNVEVWAVASSKMMETLIYEPKIVTISGTTHATLDANKGALHRCTSASAVTVTLDEDTLVNWQGLFVREGAGSVTFQKEGTDTINGSSDAVAISGQFKTAYVYQPSAGAWFVVV